MYDELLDGNMDYVEPKICVMKRSGERVPFDLIKIERGFVTTIEKSEKDRLLIGSIVDLASIFGAKTCAEGVETEDVRDILRNYRVESFQGYYYAKPLPADRLLTALAYDENTAATV